MLGLFELHAGQAGVGTDDTDYYVQLKNVEENTEGGGTGGVRPAFGGREKESQAALDPLVPSPRRASCTSLSRSASPSLLGSPSAGNLACDGSLPYSVSP